MGTMARCEQCGERFDYASQQMHIHGEQAETGKTVLPSGSTRDSDVDHLAYDLITPYGLEALARIYRRGADRHGPRNWEMGQPKSVVLNHAIAHLMSYMKYGDDCEEDCLAKVAWAMLTLIHFRDCLKSQTYRKECDEKPVENTAVCDNTERPTNQRYRF